MRSESRKHHPDGLRSISHAAIIDTTVQAAIPVHLIDAFEDDSGMDWERSRVLADTVFAQIEREPVTTHPYMFEQSASGCALTVRFGYEVFLGGFSFIGQLFLFSMPPSTAYHARNLGD